MSPSPLGFELNEPLVSSSTIEPFGARPVGAALCRDKFRNMCWTQAKLAFPFGSVPYFDRASPSSLPSHHSLMLKGGFVLPLGRSAEWLRGSERAAALGSAITKSARRRIPQCRGKRRSGYRDGLVVMMSMSPTRFRSGDIPVATRILLTTGMSSLPTLAGSPCRRSAFLPSSRRKVWESDGGIEEDVRTLTGRRRAGRKKLGSSFQVQVFSFQQEKRESL